jgi:hypothetical protein
VLQKALANESRVKESKNLQKPNEKVNRPICLLDYESEKSDGGDKDVYSARFIKISKMYLNVRKSLVSYYSLEKLNYCTIYHHLIS